ncbi:hypothetical protein [Microcoleus sp. AT9b-C5]
MFDFDKSWSSRNQAIALGILKLLKLPAVMTLGEFWCLEAIAQEYNQFD